MLVDNLLLIVLILLSNEKDARSLLQSQHVVLWVVADKHTQLALRTCSEEKPLLAAKHSLYYVALKSDHSGSLGQVRFVLQAMHEFSFVSFYHCSI